MQRLLFSIFVSTLLVAGFGWQAQAQSRSDQDNAEVLGWAIGCGCLEHDKATVVRYMENFFPGVSSQQTEGLADHISIGIKNSEEYENSEEICTTICTAADWDELNGHLSRLNANVAEAPPEDGEDLEGE